MPEALVMDRVTKHFILEGQRFSVLRGVDLTVAHGELVVLLGRSGSGKTTLLTLAGAVDRPDAGRVVLEGRDITHLHRDRVYDLRRRTVGWVFQTPGLLPLLTALENVALALEIQGQSPAAAVEPALAALAAVGLADRAQHRSFELSGGEQQRVALARALVKKPRLLLADEPTAQLDIENASEVAQLIREASRGGTTVILATHDSSLSDLADRVVHIADGHLLASV